MTIDELAGIDELGALVAPEAFERVYPIRDLEVRSDGGADAGRVIEAYAAVYDREVQVSDWEGEYREVIRSGAFDRTIGQKGNRFQVFYNHGKDLYGMPSERYAMPIGVPLEVRSEPKGLITRTKVSATPLGDEVLQLVKDGAIRGMSFGGRWVQSKLTEARRAGQLPLVERLEVDMREYGPTPFPAYEAARVLGVRNATLERLAEVVQSMSDDKRDRFAMLLGGTRSAPPADPGTGTDDGSPGDEQAARAVELDKLTLDLEQRRRRLLML